MSSYSYPISVTFDHQLRFTTGVFERDNAVLAQVLEGTGQGARVFVFLEQEVADAHAGLEGKIRDYIAERCPLIEWRGLHCLPGGERAKNDETLFRQALDLLRESGLDRHSCVLSIGGGAFLDMTGFATAVTHRGLRLVRFPTTTLSQDDSGVGVKNGINAYGLKNFLGTFAVPFAVINDFAFLDTQPEQGRRLGLVEAVKVALVKDAEFFEWMESHAGELNALEPAAFHTAVERSAVLHAEHIAFSGDAFEMGSSRPLDFGHWAAHKLEALSGFALSHAEAVSIGVAMDVLYSTFCGLMEPETAMRILQLLEDLGMPLWSPCLAWKDDRGRRLVLDGLDEFREHLGGCLTVLMLTAPGQAQDVHEIRHELVEEAISFLAARAGEEA